MKKWFYLAILLLSCSYDYQGDIFWPFLQPDAVYTIQGTISGLDGEMTLQNGDNTLQLSTDDETFTFLNLVAGESYQIEIISAPENQYCSIENATGTIQNSNIDNISIQCYTKKRFYLTDTAYTSQLASFSGSFATADSYCMADANRPTSVMNAKALLGGYNRYPGGSDWILNTETVYTRSDGTTILFYSADMNYFTSLQNSINGDSSKFWTGFDESWQIHNNCCKWLLAFKICNGSLGIGNIIDKTSIAYTISTCDDKYKILCVEQ